MAGYLEGYGAGEEHRETLIKKIVVLTAAAVVIGTSLFFFFRNYSQERTVKQFLGLLRSKDYQGAYAMWHASPRDYPFDKFLEDWGPKSTHPDANVFHLSNADACGSGVVLKVDYPGADAVSLWVERDTGIISFAPWPECPGRHWHVLGFLKSLFGGSNT